MEVFKSAFKIKSANIYSPATSYSSDLVYNITLCGYVYVTINCNHWIMINNSTTVNEDEISCPLLILLFGNSQYYSRNKKTDAAIKKKILKKKCDIFTCLVTKNGMEYTIVQWLNVNCE